MSHHFVYKSDICWTCFLFFLFFTFCAFGRKWDDVEWNSVGFIHLSSLFTTIILHISAFIAAFIALGQRPVYYLEKVTVGTQHIWFLLDNTRWISFLLSVSTSDASSIKAQSSPVKEDNQHTDITLKQHTKEKHVNQRWQSKHCWNKTSASSSAIPFRWGPKKQKKIPI